jgi:hypothetical protein
MDTQQTDWHGKPYYSLDAYCKNTFGHKCYKIALNANMSCPNRDGTKGTRGCIFCSEGGSGEFAVSIRGKSIQEQISEGVRFFGGKYTGDSFIAYFQAYTNTYAPVEYLEKIYREALSASNICGISIATRPDCLPDKVLGLLYRLRKDYPDKFIWVELGLQTIHENTAEFIRRGYPLSCFDKAVSALKDIHIPVIVHIILGLPHESVKDMLDTISYMNIIRPFGVKLQLLHVLNGTDLADLYQAGEFTVMDKDEYISTVSECIAYLSPEIVIHRITGDGSKKLLIAPKWSLNKRDVLNSLHRSLMENKITQGCLLQQT